MAVTFLDDISVSSDTSSITLGAVSALVSSTELKQSTTLSQLNVIPATGTPTVGQFKINFDSGTTDNDCFLFADAATGETTINSLMVNAAYPAGPRLEITPSTTTFTSLIVAFKGPSTGSLTGQAPVLQFSTDADSGDYYLGLRAPTALAATFTYTLPLTEPTAGQVLSSTELGVMSWATGGGADTNIANTDLTLDGDRRTDLAGFELVFDSATTDVMTLTSGDDVVIHQDLDVYGRLSPGYLKVKTPSSFTTAGMYASSAEIIFAGTIAAVSDGTCMSLGASGWGASSAASEVTAAIGLMGIKPTVTGGILTRGIVYLSHNVGGAVGDVVYLSATTAGELTTTVPTGTAGYVVRVMGYKVATNIVFFSPSKDWIVI